jgi:hypothetical protein
VNPADLCAATDVPFSHYKRVTIEALTVEPLWCVCKRAKLCLERILDVYYFGSSV